MRKYFFTLIIFHFFSGINAQVVVPDTVTVQDTVTIRKLALNRINGFASLLNLIRSNEQEDSQIKFSITNSYAANNPNQLFLTPQILIEDDIDPRNVSYLKRGDNKKVEEYLSRFDQLYNKSEGEGTVKFTDIRVSNLKMTDSLYVKVFFKSQFLDKRINEPNDPPYKQVVRVADLRVQKVDRRWKVYIARVAFASPRDSLSWNQNDVEIKQTAQIRNQADEEAEKANQEIARKMQEYRQLCIEGERLIDQGKYEEAIDKFTLAQAKNALGEKRAEQGLSKARGILANKKNDDLLFAKNLVTEMENLYARRKYSEALSKGQEAIILNPNDANALRLIAEITDKKAVHDNLNEKFLLCKNPDDHKKLLSEYNRLLKQDENNPDWYFGLARSYMAMNDLKAAENNLKKALELDRTFEDAILTRVELFKLKGDLPSAIADLDKFVALQPKNAQQLSELGKLRFQAGNAKRAEEHYNKAVSLAPDDPNIVFNRGMFYELTGRADYAREDFSIVIRNGRVLLPDAYYHRGFALTKLKRYKEAGVDFTKARSLNLKDPIALTRMDSISMALYEQGKDLIKQAAYGLIDGKPKEELAKSQKLLADAIQTFNNSIFIKPNNAESWFMKGQAYDVQKLFRKAIEDGYDKAVEFNPRQAMFFYRRGIARYNLGAYLLALEDFNYAYGVNDKYYFALAYKGVTQIALKQYVDARSTLLLIKEVEKDILKNPDYNMDFFAVLYDNLGRCEYEIGKNDNTHYEAAIAAYRKSIEYNAYDNPQAYHYLGKAYFATNKVEKAIEEFNNCIKIPKATVKYDQKIEVYLNMAEANELLKKYNEASIAYTEAMQLEPPSNQVAALLQKRGTAYFLAEKYDLASKDFESLIRSDSLSVSASSWAKAGVASIYQSQSDAAISYLQKAQAKEQNPLEQAKIQYSLACAYLQKSADTEAVNFFDKAFQITELKAILKKEKLDKLLQTARPGYADSKEFKKKYIK